MMMYSRLNIICSFVFTLCLFLNLMPARGSQTDEAIGLIADALVAQQQEGRYGFKFWPDEEAFTGTIITGLVDAYKFTSDKAYLDTAIESGSFMLWVAELNFFGSEALACVRLSKTAIQPPDNVNIWRRDLKLFYEGVQQFGTEKFISSFAGIDPSEAVLSLAEYTIAAYELGVKDKEIWREGLIEWLSAVDDSSTFPVMALGAATWALASTGPLDETLIDPFGNGKPDWKFKKLEDLPVMLLGHQVAQDQPNPGSFYWRYDHLDGGLWEADPNTPISGYTEDAIYATLGLIASVEANPELVTPEPNDPDHESDFSIAIDASRDVLLGAVSAEGKVYEMLSQEGAQYNFYAAELLMVLTRLPGDSKPETEVLNNKQGNISGRY